MKRQRLHHVRGEIENVSQDCTDADVAKRSRSWAGMIKSFDGTLKTPSSLPCPIGCHGACFASTFHVDLSGFRVESLC